MTNTDHPTQTGLATKRAIAFFDGQNLYHAAKREFGCVEADFHPLKLAKAICDKEGWGLEKVYFYTGLPDSKRFSRLRSFWAKKLEAMRWAGIEVQTREVVYRWEESPFYGDTNIILPDGRRIEIDEVNEPLYFDDTTKVPRGSRLEVYLGTEKGIDTRISVDIIRLALQRKYDVALVFSQDNDLIPVSDELQSIGAEQGRTLIMASAYPCRQDSKQPRGIDRTDWKKIDRATYDANIDTTDYWPSPKRN